MPDKPTYRFKPSQRADQRADRVDQRADRVDQRADRVDQRADQRADRFDNLNQDPAHPANRTLSPGREPMLHSDVGNAPVAVADLMTEQEKAAQAGGAAGKDNIPGVGPAASTEEVVPAETIEQQGIGPRTPYPTGDPAPPDESVTRFQGIKTARSAHNEPNKPLVKERR
jgi:hypothetical protein